MLSSNRAHQEIAAWYKGTDASPSEIAKRAYIDAVKFFENELSKTGAQHAWIRSYTSMDDVLQTVQEAKRQYDSRSDKNTRVRQCIASFASTITQFNGVFNTLSQADPLHAGLAWGAIQCVLLGVLNHEQMVGDLCEALTKIGEALPRTQLVGTLYNTPRMGRAIAKLYAHILLFLQVAVRWYKQGTIKRAVHSFTRPLPFQSTINEIKACMEVVEDIATSSSQAEIRGLSLANAALQQQFEQFSLALQQQGREMKKSDLAITSMQARLDQMSTQNSLALTQILQVATNTFDLSHTIKLDTTEIRTHVQSATFEQVCRVLQPIIEPQRMLRLSIASARRVPSYTIAGRDTAAVCKAAQKWACSIGCSLLVLKSKHRAEGRTQAMVLQILQLTKKSAIPTLWYLSCPTTNQANDSVRDVLSSLILQALHHDRSLLDRNPKFSNIQMLNEGHNLAEWKDLASQVFVHLGNCFILIEMDNIYRSLGYDRASIQQIHNVFCDIYQSVSNNGGRMKMLIVSREGVVSSFKDDHLSRGFFTATVDGPLPVASRIKASPYLRLNLVQRSNPVSVWTMAKSTS